MSLPLFGRRDEGPIFRSVLGVSGVARAADGLVMRVVAHSRICHWRFRVIVVIVIVYVMMLRRQVLLSAIVVFAHAICSFYFINQIYPTFYY